MSQKLVNQNKKQQPQPQVTTSKVETEEDILLRAKQTYAELESANKIPQEYKDLVKEALHITKQSSREFVTKFEQVLYKASIRGQKAKDLIIVSCSEIGWSYNTYRRYFTDNLKNKNKGKGPKSAALTRREVKNKKISESRKEQQSAVEELENLKPTLEIISKLDEPILKSIVVSPEISEHFLEKIKFSKEHGGKGSIKQDFRIRVHKETAEVDIEIINVAAIFPTDRERRKESTNKKEVHLVKQ